MDVYFYIFSNLEGKLFDLAVKISVDNLGCFAVTVLSTPTFGWVAENLGSKTTQTNYLVVCSNEIIGETTVFGRGTKVEEQRIGRGSRPTEGHSSTRGVTSADSVLHRDTTVVVSCSCS